MLESTRGDNDDKKIRHIMSSFVGVLRDKAGLEKAVSQLHSLAEQSDMALTALMIATAALRREESRGAHARTDHPATSHAWAHRQNLTLADIMPLPATQTKKRRA
jgi:L-aspartate oxidase